VGSAKGHGEAQGESRPLVVSFSMQASLCPQSSAYARKRWQRPMIPSRLSIKVWDRSWSESEDVIRVYPLHSLSRPGQEGFWGLGLYWPIFFKPYVHGHAVSFLLFGLSGLYPATLLSTRCGSPSASLTACVALFRDLRARWPLSLASHRHSWFSEHFLWLPLLYSSPVILLCVSFVDGCRGYRRQRHCGQQGLHPQPAVSS
jgi:hypothetical protein